MRNAALYFDQLRLQLVALSYFRLDFWVGICASMLQHGAALAVLWLVYGQVSSLGGWGPYPATLLYAFFSLTWGLATFLGSGLRELPALVMQGELDSVLILPMSPYVRLLPRLNLSALGDVAVAVVILLAVAGPAGVQWTPVTALYALVAVVCGTGLLLGFLTVLYALSFWVPYNGLMRGAEGVAGLARYPATIYPLWLRAAITWVLPVTFASHYPAAELAFGGGGFLGSAMGAAVAAACLLGAGALAWRSGLRKYEGAGS
ncbi:MAG TPA: ABC-2 family transporter protein [Symbiobacteriaceae bacterium]|nr:ABC-2 family transporter protein [Symbiobacteriaceae bacterium]